MRAVPVLLTTGLFWVGSLAWAQVPGMGTGVGGTGTVSPGQQVDGGGGGMSPAGGGAGGVTG